MLEIDHILIYFILQVLSQLRQMICPDPQEVDDDVNEIAIDEEENNYGEEVYKIPN